MKKHLTAILMTTIFILSLLVPALSMNTVMAADPSSWYMSVNGVLQTDYYSLYPFETNTSLKVGFSKFGELINSNDNTGLEFGAVDPFAPPAGSSESIYVPKRDWLNGWLINITYNHRILGPRNVWATAQHSDAQVYGNDWIRVDLTNDWSPTYGWEDPRDPGYQIYGSGAYGATLDNGGRKTNGTAVTAPINVLYNGPREFIAECRTTIYDHPLFGSNSTGSDIPLVQVVITIVFDKVKKEVNLLKDVKSLLVEKEGVKMKIQFSNRGEVDLGTDTAGYSSYGHFYTEGTWVDPSLAAAPDDRQEGMSTVYNRDWQLIQTEDPEDQEFIDYSAAGPYPQTSDATFDVAQAINARSGNVWYAAFWPSLSDWTIDGWEQWWHSLTTFDPHHMDFEVASDEPFIPYYIGEWDFVLYHKLDSQNRTQFRGVTQYGVTFLHDAKDEAMVGNPANRLDREVQYYLNETFNPWDLFQSVEKETMRWVEWKIGAGATFRTTHSTVVVVSNSSWDQYAQFSERIYAITGSNAFKLLNRWKGDYNIVLNSDGTATISGLSTSTNYKILYSTRDPPGGRLFVQLGLCLDDSGSIDPSDWTLIKNGVASAINNDLPHDGTIELTVVQFSNTARTAVTPTIITQANFAAIATTIQGLVQQAGATAMAAGLNQTWSLMKNSPNFALAGFQVVNVATDGVPNIALDGIQYNDLEDPASSDVSATRNIAAGQGLDEIDAEGIGLGVNVPWMVANLTLPQPGNIATPYIPGWVQTVANAAAFADAMAAKIDAILPDYKGRYEWAEVGRDASSVDSAGAVMVGEAFDSLKDIRIGMAGEDMQDTNIANQMPNLMAKFSGTGSEGQTTNYKDAASTPWNVPGFRTALLDDWCTYWPVASSNIIGIGGPIANLLAYYANDFTSVLYGLPQFSGAAYANKMVPVPCWDRAWPPEGNYRTYVSDNNTGYATVSTYLDINGTELFMVWGNWGRDTYYASLWLHGDAARNMSPGIVQLQEAPAGLVSIILKINYADPKHPTYTIVESLGTISETLWYHQGSDVTDPYKGGIHDP